MKSKGWYKLPESGVPKLGLKSYSARGCRRNVITKSQVLAKSKSTAKFVRVRDGLELDSMTVITSSD